MDDAAVYSAFFLPCQRLLPPVASLLLPASGAQMSQGLWLLKITSEDSILHGSKFYMYFTW